LSLSLPFRAPFDAAGVFGWLTPRAVTGVEIATATSYSRTLRLPGGPARFEVRFDGRALRLDARLTQLGDLPVLVSRVRRLFDLDADPIAVDTALSADPILAPRVSAVPGIRLPGAVDAEEMLFRAIIDQQITVAAARTQLNRLTDACGTTLEPSENTDGLTRLFPTATQIAANGREALVGPRAKIDTVMRLADALASGGLSLSLGDDAAEQHARLTAFAGIGDWTAGYVGMRVLGNPDIFLAGDVAVRSGARRLGLPGDARTLTAYAAGLSPWRSYLCLHLWRAAALPAPIPEEIP
jgi:AraC family transcriptional regulator of adaptative response / DNA-3-methyladenine glycosylase II